MRGPREIFFVCSVSCFTSQAVRVMEKYDGALSTRPKTSARPLSEPSSARSVPAGRRSLFKHTSRAPCPLPPPAGGALWVETWSVCCLVSWGVARPSRVVNKGRSKCVIYMAPTTLFRSFVEEGVLASLWDPHEKDGVDPTHADRRTRPAPPPRRGNGACALRL